MRVRFCPAIYYGSYFIYHRPGRASATKAISYKIGFQFIYYLYIFSLYIFFIYYLYILKVNRILPPALDVQKKDCLKGSQRFSSYSEAAGNHLYQRCSRICSAPAKSYRMFSLPQKEKHPRNSSSPVLSLNQPDTASVNALRLLRNSQGLSPYFR